MIRQPFTSKETPLASSLLNFSAATPILNVKNLQASMDYYVQKLGFEKMWDWGDPPDFGGPTDRLSVGHSRDVS